MEGVTGRGTGLNTFTSGFEGPWTETPTDWDNEYFTNLLAFDWKLEKGPSGAEQYVFPKTLLHCGDINSQMHHNLAKLARLIARTLLQFSLLLCKWCLKFFNHGGIPTLTHTCTILHKYHLN